MAPLRLRGRVFTDQDLDLIRELLELHWEKGRSYISRAICEALDWKQPNGWPKDRACRDVLRRLEKTGPIQLPPPLVTRKRQRAKPKMHGRDLLKPYDLRSCVRDFPGDVSFTMAKGNDNEAVWNALVDQYHYLGHSVTVGRCIKYLIRGDGRLIGAVSFSSPAWHLETRDRILRSIGIDDVRERTINNSRFLILPHVKVPNLASHLLSLATKRIVRDWESYYAITPLVAETFVQPSLFDGTCYRAANWILVGRTKGYAKRGLSYTTSQECKLVFLYGLTGRIRHDLREVAMPLMKGEKAISGEELPR